LSLQGVTYSRRAGTRVPVVGPLVGTYTDAARSPAMNSRRVGAC
jgi:hypothetical protein